MLFLIGLLVDLFFGVLHEQVFTIPVFTIPVFTIVCALSVRPADGAKPGRDVCTPTSFNKPGNSVATEHTAIAVAAFERNA